MLSRPVDCYCILASWRQAAAFDSQQSHVSLSECSIHIVVAADVDSFVAVAVVADAVVEADVSSLIARIVGSAEIAVGVAGDWATTAWSVTVSL